MTYTPLWKLYYQNPEEYETVYKSYMNSPVTQYLGVEIRQYNHEKSYPAFMLYTREILLLAEEIDRLHMQLVDIVHHVPPEVLKQFALLCIVDEVKSTNDIEGVRSTKQEIRNILNEKSAETTRLNNVVNKYKSLITQTSHTENIPYALINQLELNVESHSRTLLCTQTTHPKSGQIVQESFQERFDQQDF